MKEIKVTGIVAKRFYDMCIDCINAKDTDLYNMRYGILVGFASALYLSKSIDNDCYEAMLEYVMYTVAPQALKNIGA